MVFDEVFKYDNLYKAYKECCKGKMWKASTTQFIRHATTNISEIQEELMSGNYKPGNYNVFEVTSPKKRVIKSIKFKDKVVQKSLCDNVVYPTFDKHFIYDNYACRKGKGVHAAVKRTCDFFRRAYFENGTKSYVLKCDIEKYFDSIDHEILKDLISRYITDQRVLELLTLIIDSANSEEGKGLPLGNQTSQLFSLFYLSAFDHYVKEVLGIKFYLRYMDDFVLISHDKAYLQYCKKEIAKYLDTLKLKLNHKSHIFPIGNGVDFLGYHIYLTDSGKVIKKVRRDSKKRIKRKLKYFKTRYNEGTMTREQIQASYRSWVGHAQHANSYYLLEKIEGMYLSIFEE